MALTPMSELSTSTKNWWLGSWGARMRAEENRNFERPNAARLVGPMEGLEGGHWLCNGSHYFAVVLNKTKPKNCWSCFWEEGEGYSATADTFTGSRDSCPCLMMKHKKMKKKHGTHISQPSQTAGSLIAFGEQHPWLTLILYLFIILPVLHFPVIHHCMLV